MVSKMSYNQHSNSSKTNFPIFSCSFTAPPFGTMKYY